MSNAVSDRLADEADAALDRQHQTKARRAQLEAACASAAERATAALARHQSAASELRHAQRAADDAAVAYATARAEREEAERALREATPAAPRAVDPRVSHITPEQWDAIHETQCAVYAEFDRLRGQDTFNPGDRERVEVLRQAERDARTLPLARDIDGEIVRLRSLLRH